VLVKHVENLFRRQRSPRASQPVAVERGFEIDSRGTTMDRRLIGLVLGLVMASGGCLSQGWPAAEVSPGKANVTEALDALKQQAGQAGPFKANGQCRMGYVAASGRTRQFNLPVSVFVNPPSEVYLQGQATPGPQGLVFMGTNAEEFWLGLRPEVSTFWWGRWDKAADTHALPVDPRAVFEALGLAAVGLQQEDPNRWSLSSAGGQDILTWKDPAGRPAKRLLVDRRDYRIARIEYLDEDGNVIVLVDLKDYEKAAAVMWVPSRISIVAYAKGRQGDWARLTFDTFMAWTPREEFRSKKLVRPEPSGFENVIEIGNQEK
jgi:hypothetical protein